MPRLFWPGYGVVTLYGVAPPRLQVSQEGAGRLTFAWSPAPVGFTLQSTASLLPPANWLADTNPTVFSNNAATVTVPATTTQRFYRLVLP